VSHAHRAKDLSPSRRALLAAGIATLSISLLLSIAPVLAAKGGSSSNANSGTIKIHDATTDQETAENDNDPHVCSFWVGFHATDPYEAGSWQLLSWAPTGDGSIVDSGDYDTTGDGDDATGVLNPAPGHYRFDWQPVGGNAKHKTLWVDDTCGTDETPPSDEETPPSDEETPPSQEETPPSDEEAPPTDEEAPPSQDEAPPSQDEAPPTDEEAPPSDEEAPPSDEEAPPSDEEAPPSQDEAPPTDEEAPPTDEEAPPSDEEAPPSDEEAPPSDEEAPPSEPPTTAPEGAVEAGTSGQHGGSSLPDTAIPLESTGMLAALGLLMIVAAHAGTKRRQPQV
jgi:hypothetical protein